MICSMTLALIDADASLPTNRLVLEPLTEHHADAMYAALSDERVYRHIPDDPPDSPARLAERYRRLADRRSPAGDQLWLNWAILLKDSGVCLGRVEATVYEDGTAALAYLLGPEHWGAGYATEACTRIVELLFDPYRASTVFAEVETENHAGAI